jgi:hypothetical protein
MVTHCPQLQLTITDPHWTCQNLLLVFDPGTYVFGLAAKITADASTFRADAFVSPLIKGRYGDAAKVRRDILRSPQSILNRSGTDTRKAAPYRYITDISFR